MGLLEGVPTVMGVVVGVALGFSVGVIVVGGSVLTMGLSVGVLTTIGLVVGVSTGLDVGEDVSPKRLGVGGAVGERVGSGVELGGVGAGVVGSGVGGVIGLGFTPGGSDGVG